MTVSNTVRDTIVVAVLMVACIHEGTSHFSQQAFSQSSNVQDCIEELIDRKIEAAKLCESDQPVTRILGFSLNGDRLATLTAINGTTLKGAGVLDQISLTNSNAAKSITGANKNMAYRPSFKDYHKMVSPTGTIFINMRGVFPCLGKAGFSPICKIFSREEDGFGSGKQLLEAADWGNNFRIFSSSSNIPTFAFGFKGCPQLKSDCLPTWYAVTIVCHLPRNLCA